MKALKLLLALFLTTTFVSSCVVAIGDDIVDNRISLEQLVTSYDLWYVDINKSTIPNQNRDVQFLTKAFTISFENGRLYANNNLVGIGSVGSGYGDQIGFYNTKNGVLEVDHSRDGFIDLRVEQVSIDKILLIDTLTNTRYVLIGYYKNNFDFRLIQYDNIEYFLQEYVAWEKTYVSEAGALNEFDNENFLEFTPGNTNKFRSSKDKSGTNVDLLIWDFVGNYKVFNVEGRNDLKILTLDYDFFDNEAFELSIINDSLIKLFHRASGTTYEFKGRKNIQFKNGTTKQKPRNSKRFKTNRKTKKIAVTA